MDNLGHCNGRACLLTLDAMLVLICMHAYTHNRYEFYMAV